MNHNLFDQFAATIADPGKTAITTLSGERLSYADVVSLSAKMAGALVSLGLSPGDRVAAQVEKSIPALILYLATIRAGGVFLPLNTAYTLAELAYFIGDAEPRIVVCDPQKRDGIAGLALPTGATIATLDASGSGSLMQAVQAARDEVATVPRAAEALAAILYTSGTTGRSKGAMLTQDNLVSNARTLIEAWRFSTDDVLIHALPIYHTHGLFVATNCVLFSGAAMIFLPRFNPDDVLAALPTATSLMGVPTFYTRLLRDARLDRESTAHMRLFVSGSAPLLAETHREWQARTGHAILERYGMTETSMNTSNPYDGDRVPGTVGFPLPGIALRIADPETGGRLGTNEIGMIEVKGPNVFRGYWRMPDRTAAELRGDGFFITGDLGKVDERGYVHIVGRGKDLIITGGFNVYPKEVEAEIDDLPGIVESAVIGVAHPDFGEGVVAVVVAEKDAVVDEAGVIGALETRLAKFKLPKRVLVVPDLPRNTMGKVQKNLLREIYCNLFAKSPPAGGRAVL